MSLDGRTAAADGSSQWITGDRGARRRAPAARRVAGGRRRARHRPCGSAAPHGAERSTATVVRQPLRVLLDARGRVAGRGPAVRPDARADARHHDRAGPGAGASTRGRPRARRSKSVEPGPHGRGVDLVAVLTLLAERYGVLQAMVEGGGHLHGAFVAERLADRLVAYVAPVLLGERGLPVIGFPGPESLADALAWQLRDVTRFGADVRSSMDPPADRRRGGLMFTGIIEELGRVRAVDAQRRRRADRDRRDHGARATRSSARRSRSTAAASPSSSSATGGGRRTRSPRRSTAPASARCAVGDPVNLERPLRLADRLGGHLVQGHVDGVGELVERRAAARRLDPHAVPAARPQLALHRGEGLDHGRRHQPDRGRAARRRLRRRGHPAHARRDEPRCEAARRTRSTWRSTCSRSTSSASWTQRLREQVERHDVRPHRERDRGDRPG